MFLVVAVPAILVPQDAWTLASLWGKSASAEGTWPWAEPWASSWAPWAQPPSWFSSDARAGTGGTDASTQTNEEHLFDECSTAGSLHVSGEYGPSEDGENSHSIKVAQSQAQQQPLVYSSTGDGIAVEGGLPGHIGAQSIPQDEKVARAWCQSNPSAGGETAYHASMDDQTAAADSCTARGILKVSEFPWSVAEESSPLQGRASIGGGADTGTSQNTGCVPTTQPRQNLIDHEVGADKTLMCKLSVAAIDAKVPVPDEDCYTPDPHPQCYDISTPVKSNDDVLHTSIASIKTNEPSADASGHDPHASKPDEATEEDLVNISNMIANGCDPAVAAQLAAKLAMYRSWYGHGKAARQ